MSPVKKNPSFKHKIFCSWWSKHDNYHISTCLQKVDIQDVDVNFEATACRTGHKLMNT